MEDQTPIELLRIKIPKENEEEYFKKDKKIDESTYGAIYGLIIFLLNLGILFKIITLFNL
jgi:hypothetical protein